MVIFIRHYIIHMSWDASARNKLISSRYISQYTVRLCLINNKYKLLWDWLRTAVPDITCATDYALSKKFKTDHSLRSAPKIGKNMSLMRQVWHDASYTYATYPSYPFFRRVLSIPDDGGSALSLEDDKLVPCFTHFIFWVKESRF